MDLPTKSDAEPVTRTESSTATVIVDAHQHFGDPIAHYYPWLNADPPIQFRYGDYRAVNRRYLPPDYRKDAAPFRVEQSVYVEAEWDPGDQLRVDRLHRSGLA